MGVDYSWNDDCAGAFAWAIDFIKAIEDRPWYIKLILRLTLGKYAVSEFMGLRNHFLKHHYIDGYELKDMEYHNESHPIIWWKNVIEN